MQDLLVKDFASELNVTPAAIYKQMDKHRTELEGKVIKKPKQTWLTPEAQEIIRSYTIQPPALVVESETLAELQQLRHENDELRTKYTAELEKSRLAAEQIANLSKNAGLLEAAQQQKANLTEQLAREKAEHISREKELQTERDAARERAGRAEEERDAARERATRAESERNAAITDRDEKAKLLFAAAAAIGVLIVAVIVVAIFG